MTVKELREALSKFPDDMLVVVLGQDGYEDKPLVNSSNEHFQPKKIPERVLL